MTAPEFTRKKQLLHGYEMLLKNPAHAEMRGLFVRHQANALAGLRNRNTTREKRDEYLQAAEDADEALGFVDARIKALSAELQIPPDDDEDFPQEP